jgi:hypothetical protein
MIYIIKLSESLKNIQVQETVDDIFGSEILLVSVYLHKFISSVVVVHLKCFSGVFLAKVLLLCILLKWSISGIKHITYIAAVFPAIGAKTL